MGLRRVVALSLSFEGDAGVSRDQAVKNISEKIKTNMKGIAVKSKGTTLDGKIINPNNVDPLNYENKDSNGEKKFTI
jgi:hypothetical protein